MRLGNIFKAGFPISSRTACSTAALILHNGFSGLKLAPRGDFFVLCRSLARVVELADTQD